MLSGPIPTETGWRELKRAVNTAWWSLRVAGGCGGCFLRKTGASINRRWGGAGAAMSGELRTGTSSLGSADRALVRGEDVGLSAARYVVAKMLSRSESWGRSTDDFQSVSPCAFGAVLERPVCASVFGVTASCCSSGANVPWPASGAGGVFDLTDAGGEVFAWASGSCDMGSTLVQPSRRRSRESVEECLVAARVGIVGAAAGRHSGTPDRGSLACEE
jgi:hypothetical protein